MGDLDGVAFAVSIPQPWASITVEGHRRYHSLTFRPPTIPLGKQIAIYSAVKADLEAADQAIHLLDSIGVTKAERLAWGTRTVRGAIIGVATFAGVVAQSDDPWFVGPYALWLTGADRKSVV